MSVFESLHQRSLGIDSPSKFARATMMEEVNIQRLELSTELKGHEGCVNTILFSNMGDHVITGSDDTKINVYKVGSWNLEASLDTEHTSNVFWARDKMGSDMNSILSCAADGRVCLMEDIWDPTMIRTRTLHKHRGRAHRLDLIQGEPEMFYSCGEDGEALLYDLRVNTTTSSDSMIVSRAQFKSTTAPIRRRYGRSSNSIYCIASNPVDNNYFAISGILSTAHLYDRRKMDAPVDIVGPLHLRQSSVTVTGLRYSYDAQELLLSYNDEDCYTVDVTPQGIVAMKVAEAEANMTNNKKQRKSSSSSSSSLQKKDGEDDEEEDIEEEHEGKEEEEEHEGKEEEEEEEEEDIENALQGPGFKMRFKGHQNNDTVKQVAYVGHESNFVVSGSDCGRIFIWNAKDGKLVKLLEADSIGATNCLACHPHLPILASSGLQNNAKIWTPTGERISAEQVMREAAPRPEREGMPSMMNHRSLVFSLLSSLLQSQGGTTRAADGVTDDGDDNDEEARMARAQMFLSTLDSLGLQLIDSDLDDNDDDDDDDDDDGDDDDDDDETRSPLLVSDEG